MGAMSTCGYYNCDTVRRCTDSSAACRQEAQRLNAKIRRLRRKWGAELGATTGYMARRDEWTPLAQELWEDMECLERSKHDVLTSGRNDRAILAYVDRDGQCISHLLMQERKNPA